MSAPAPHETDRVTLSIERIDQTLKRAGSAGRHMSGRAMGRTNHTEHPPRTFCHDTVKPFRDSPVRLVPRPVSGGPTAGNRILSHG